MSNYPTVRIACVGNVYTRMMIFKNKGDVEQGHTHNFDHATLVANGSVLIRAKGKETIFNAPTIIWIAKDVEHELEALLPNTVCACIHALRGEDAEIIDPDMIPGGPANPHGALSIQSLTAYQPDSSSATTNSAAQPDL